MIIVWAFLAALVQASLLCDSCYYPMEGVRVLAKLVIPRWVVKEGLEILCQHKYDSKPLCQKVGKQISPIAINSLLDNYLNPHKICSSLCGHEYLPYQPQVQVDRILNSNSIPSDNLQQYLKHQYRQIQTDKAELNILHLTDIHLDLNYAQKSSVNCQYPICCHAEDGYPDNPDAQAKPYGSIKCDSPPKLLDSALQYIHALPTDIDMIIATGDFSAHDEWEKTEATIFQNEAYISQAIKSSLGQNSIVVVAAGNNDYTPDHQTPPLQLPYLIKTTTIKTNTQTITYLSLNNVVCDNYNMFLFGDQTYAVYQLRLLQQELAANDNVYILGHIPPNLDQCAQAYTTVYRALITKYSHKVKGQFFGHTHADQLFVNTSPQSKDVVGFGLISGSLSPYHVGQSRFRIYQISHEGVIDYKQHHFTNLNASIADWKFQYGFRQRHHLPDTKQPITLDEIEKIVQLIMTDESSRQQYIEGTRLGLQLANAGVLHCTILDEPEKLSQCRKNYSDMPMKLYSLIEKLRGKWEYLGAKQHFGR